MAFAQEFIYLIPRHLWDSIAFDESDKQVKRSLQNIEEQECNLVCGVGLARSQRELPVEGGTDTASSERADRILVPTTQLCLQATRFGTLVSMLIGRPNCAYTAVS